MRLVGHHLLYFQIIGAGLPLSLFVECVDLDLAVDEPDHVIYGGVGGNAEVIRGLVVGGNHAFDGLGEQGLRPRVVLHEIEREYIVEEGVDLLLVVKVDAVVKLCKFQNNLDGLRLVAAREARVAFAGEDALAAFEDKVGANRILLMIEGLVPLFLLGEEDYYSEVAWLPRHCDTIF